MKVEKHTKKGERQRLRNTWSLPCSLKKHRSTILYTALPTAPLDGLPDTDELYKNNAG